LPRTALMFANQWQITNRFGVSQDDSNMVAKTSRTRRESTDRVEGKDIPLRNHAEQALESYFANLNGHPPAHLYDLVLREVEEPLFRAVLDYASGNQSQAAVILGINRGTLRKKLRQFGLSH
jgi:Fis family transcriptional regulator